MTPFRICLAFLLAIPASQAQLTRSDASYAGLSARSRQLPYQQAGGDMKAIAPLMAAAANAATDPVAAYRGLTHAIVLMSGGTWTPDAELASGLDFSIHSKIIGTGEYLESHATFLFDAPAAANSPYRMDLQIDDQTAVEPAIALGDVRGRRMGETIGVTFDPSKLAGAGSHTLVAALKDGHGTNIHRYYRTFSIVPDLTNRLAALEKTVELLPDQRSEAAISARWIFETLNLAHQTYLSTGFQGMSAYLFTGYRTAGLGATEIMDYNAALERATKLAKELQAGSDPIKGATGDIPLAYRSGFDGKLVSYRIYVPTKYDKAKKYPLIVLLHGAGGDESNFFDGYSGMFPKLAEERGYILAAVSGRGPFSGYVKANGAEQDVLDVLDLMQKHYSIDPARVYLCGHSMGAAGTWRIGLEYRDRFAALAPIAGSSVTPALETALASGRKIPIAIVAGAKDSLVPVAGCRAASEKAKSLGYPVQYLEYADGDHLTVVAMGVRGVFDWFDQHPSRPLLAP
ncbi:MAG TPA: alpha/beta fold hydrolase [Bryobacteraceae bacterium]|nr:alpha/beta fold hydrolase [Bryobacteraceae bacterium]